MTIQARKSQSSQTRRTLQLEKLDSRQLMAADVPLNISAQNVSNSDARVETQPFIDRSLGNPSKSISPVRGISPLIGGGRIENSFDQVVAIGSETRNSFCTGTLITPLHVLSAAHCFDSLDAAGNKQPDGQLDYGHTGYRIRIGTDGTGFDQTVNSAHVAIHEFYNAQTFDNDVALVTLFEPVSAAASILPSVTNYTGQNLYRGSIPVGTRALAVGYAGEQVRRSGVIEIDTVTRDRLSWQIDSVNSGEVATEPGDSGGPSFVSINENVLIAGVHSTRSVDEKTEEILGFSDMRISAYSDWIVSKVGLRGDTGGPRVIGVTDLTEIVAGQQVAFRIRYYDAGGVDRSSIDHTDIGVRGTNNHVTTYASFGESYLTDIPGVIEGRYIVDKPINSTGPLEIWLRPGAVTDLAGNASQSMKLGEYNPGIVLNARILLEGGKDKYSDVDWRPFMLHSSSKQAARYNSSDAELHTDDVTQTEVGRRLLFRVHGQSDLVLNPTNEDDIRAVYMHVWMFNIELDRGGVDRGRTQLLTEDLIPLASLRDHDQRTINLPNGTHSYSKKITRGYGELHRWYLFREQGLQAINLDSALPGTTDGPLPNLKNIFVRIDSTTSNDLPYQTLLSHANLRIWLTEKNSALAPLTAEPLSLSWTSADLAAQEPVTAQADETHVLQSTDGQFSFVEYIDRLSNHFEEDEKWVRNSNDELFFVKSNGELYRWDGQLSATGIYITTLPLTAYESPSILIDADGSSISSENESDDVPIFTNPFVAADVDGNGNVTPVDALRIINRISIGGHQSVGDLHSSDIQSSDVGFLDVNGDGFVSVIDALRVLNDVNRQAAATLSPVNVLDSNDDDYIIDDDTLRLIAMSQMI